MVDGVILIFLAVQEGNPEKLKKLLSEQPDLANTWRMDPIPTPLHACVFKPQIARILLEAGADPGSIDTDDSMRTPLHACVEAGDLETTKVLIENGADINVRSRWGTPLHHATGSNDGTIPSNSCALVEYLIEAGADLDASINPDTDIWTPLHQVCSEGMTEEAELLITKGAKVYLGKDGLTPLRVAQSMGFSDLADLLSRHGAQ